MHALKKLFNFIQHNPFDTSANEVLSQPEVDKFFELANHQLISVLSKYKSHNHSFGDNHAQVKGAGNDYSQSRQYVK